MLTPEPPSALDLDADDLIRAVACYLRLDVYLKRAGALPLVEQEDWAEAALWEYACEAADRLERLQAAR
jgi:hypothetical protein